MKFKPGTYKTSELIDEGVLQIGDGYRAKNTELASSGIPFARAGNINNGFLFDEADLFPIKDLSKVGDKTSKVFDSVFTSKGTVGRIAYVKEGTQEFVYSPQLCYWRSLDFEVINPRFMNFWMNGSEFKSQIDYLKGQTDMADYVSLRDQRKMTFTLPDIAVQRNIAEILGALDDKIELNRQINQTLEQIAQAIFKSWFVDFEPVKAKIEAKAAGRDSELAAMCAISGKIEPELRQLPPELYQQLAATAALFPDELVQSDLGLIPEGWEIDEIYGIADVIYGAPFASKKFNSDGFGKPLIRIRDLKNEDPGVFTPEVHPKGYLVQPGDIVVGMDGEFRAYLWGGEEAWLNQRVCVFKTKAGVSATFVRNSIIPCLAAVEASETATTVIHLGKNDIDRFRIVIPKSSVMEAFGMVADPIYAQIVSLKQSSRALATLRETLLPKLLSGELSAEENENLAENEHGS